jgi:hypothetical protein
MADPSQDLSYAEMVRCQAAEDVRRWRAREAWTLPDPDCKREDDGATPWFAYRVVGLPHDLQLTQIRTST